MNNIELELLEGVKEVEQIKEMYKFISTYNANLFIFDAYGEYKNAFKSINQINPNYQYKFITTNPAEQGDELLQIPVYLLSNDDLALLLNAENHSQLTIIERANKLAKIFS